MTDFDTVADFNEGASAADAGTDSGFIDAGDASELNFDNFDDYANHRVTVKVGGAEERVPLGELRNGYMRQADYTRKTQEVAQFRKEAEWAQALRSALSTDPQGTLSTLAEHLGVSFQGGQVEEYESDPRIQTIEQRIAAFERQQAQLNLERELDSLASRYDDLDRDSLVRYAVANKIENLDLAYRAMTWDAKAEAALRAEAERKRVEEEAGIVDRKRQASVVSGGRGANPSAASSGGTTRDVLMATARELGITF